MTFLGFAILCFVAANSFAGGQTEAHSGAAAPGKTYTIYWATNHEYKVYIKT